MDGVDAERLAGPLRERLPATTWMWRTAGSSSSTAIITTARGVSTQAVEPRMLASAPRLRSLPGWRTPIEEAAELVGEPVQRRDRVADFGVAVRVAVADVVRDRVDDEQPDAAELARELAELVDVVGELDVLLDDAKQRSMTAPAATSRGYEVDLGASPRCEMKSDVCPAG